MEENLGAAVVSAENYQRLLTCGKLHKPQAVSKGSENKWVSEEDLRVEEIQAEKYRQAMLKEV